MTTAKMTMMELMYVTKYKVFKRCNTNGKDLIVTMVLPKKSNLFYTSKKGIVELITARTKDCLSTIGENVSYKTYSMGIMSDLCIIEMTIHDYLNTVMDYRVIDFKNDKVCTLSINGNTAMAITMSQDDGSVINVDFFDPKNITRTTNNNIANIIVGISDIETFGTDDNVLNVNTRIVFDAYRIFGDNVTQIKSYEFDVPFVLLSEDYNYNKDILLRLHSKICDDLIK